jgi:hypothetical protein
MPVLLRLGHGRREKISAMRVLYEPMTYIIVVMIAIMTFSTVVSAQGTQGQFNVVDNQWRPLQYMADRLQELSGDMVITYEDPCLVWDGDISYMSSTSGTRAQPRRRSVILPEELKNEKHGEALANIVLEYYHSQTDGPRYKILKSAWGLHIVPAQVRNRNGQLEEAVPLLDTIVSIPKARRTPSEHIDAVCAAVNALTPSGIRLKAGQGWLNEYFAPHELVKETRYLLTEDVEKVKFEWGTDGKKARDAVIELLDNSSTTLTWRLLCDPNENICVLNMLPITINVTNAESKLGKETLFHDRDNLLRSRGKQ